MVESLKIDPRQLPDDGEWTVEFDRGWLIFGEGTLEQLGDAARALGCRSVLLVTDPGIRGAGHVDRAVRSLTAEGVGVEVFDGVEENPTTRHVAAGVAAARAFSPQGIVGLGGGSSMDCAKAINFLLTNGGRMEDYWGEGKAGRSMLPSIGVPTTAGTGSEAQSFALVSQEESHVKMACGDPKARFRTVILDPTLVESAPKAVAAVTAIDALSHAAESYVCTRRNPLSSVFAAEAWRRIESSLPTFLADPRQVAARASMLLGAHFAGTAIEHSMLGGAHACANPLTQRYGITHGIAVGLMLPHVMRFNREAVGDLYDELQFASAGPSAAVRPEDRVEALRDLAGLPSRLRDTGAEREELDRLAGEAEKQWTAGFNPRPLSREELRGLYAQAW